jgi:nitrogenase molybdenum-iron protein NifN
MPFIHGSQGCSTYIRRYLIGHFREPMDIACSNFSEQSAVFGGKDNLQVGLENVARQYQPQLIGVSTTCLSETIGDDCTLFLHQIEKQWRAGPMPLVVPVSTPSYQGSHAEGFHRAVRALVDALAEPGEAGTHVNVFGNMISPEDIRYLQQILRDFGLEGAVIPDYSDTLDGPSWETYERLPSGGTPIEALRRSGSAQASIEFSTTITDGMSAGFSLAERLGVRHLPMRLPIGMAASDVFFRALASCCGRDIPEVHTKERGRLVDAYVDAHKYLFEKRAVVYGEEDLVVGLAAFLAEIGIVPVVCASGGPQDGRLQRALDQALPQLTGKIEVMADADFGAIEAAARATEPDILIGNSNGAKIARALDVPLVRVGLPVHDRLGAARLMHIGYRGTQQLFDRIVNAFIKQKQEASPVGYTHM